MVLVLGSTAPIRGVLIVKLTIEEIRDIPRQDAPKETMTTAHANPCVRCKWALPSWRVIVRDFQGCIFNNNPRQGMLQTQSLSRLFRRQHSQYSPIGTWFSVSFNNNYHSWAKVGLSESTQFPQHILNISTMPTICWSNKFRTIWSSK